MLRNEKAKMANKLKESEDLNEDLKNQVRDFNKLNQDYDIIRLVFKLML